MRDETATVATLAALAAATLVALPAAGAADVSSLDTSRIHGQGELDVIAEDPTLFLRDEMLPGSVEVTGEELEVERVDDWKESVQAQTPTGPVELASYNDRNVSTHQHTDLDRVRLLTLTEPDATMIVKPLASGTQLSAHHDGDYEAEPVEDKMLEHSHVASPNATYTDQYYEYRADDELGLEIAGESEILLEGSFEVYLWGAMAEVVANETQIYETGHWVEDRSEGAKTVTEEHFVFVRMRIEDGALEASIDGVDTLAAFAGTLHADLADSGDVTFEDADGILPGPDLFYEATGETVRAQDGTYTWSHAGDQIATDTLEAPTSVAGGQPVGDNEALGGWGMWSLAAAIGLVAVVGAARTLRPYVDEARAWVRERRVKRWMRTGDRLTAVRDYEAACGYFAKITERYPEISEAWYSQGIVLQELGRHDEAAEAFVEAERAIQEDEPELLEKAATEAWRADEEEQARELFERLAILDPIRLRRKVQTPAFAALRSKPWMQDLLDIDERTDVHYA